MHEISPKDHTGHAHSRCGEPVKVHRKLLTPHSDSVNGLSRTPSEAGIDAPLCLYWLLRYPHCLVRHGDAA